MATIYGFDYDRSSAYEYLTSAAGSNYLVYSVFSLFSSFAFFINRSELWGLFFARYNPNIQELMFGTGPYSLSNHYSEIDIVSLRVNTGDPLGFLLPHSSMLLCLSFFGLFGSIFIIYLLINQIRKIKKYNYEIYIIVVFIFINLIKSDSILYIPSLITYFIYFSSKALVTNISFYMNSFKKKELKIKIMKYVKISQSIYNQDLSYSFSIFFIY